MKKKKIDVTIICPGFVATDISFNTLEGKGLDTHQHDTANAQGLTLDEFDRKISKAAVR